MKTSKVEINVWNPETATSEVETAVAEDKRELQHIKYFDKYLSGDES